MREVLFVEAVREAQAEALEADERVFVMGQEVGVYGASSGLRKGSSTRLVIAEFVTCRSPSNRCSA